MESRQKLPFYLDSLPPFKNSHFQSLTFHAIISNDKNIMMSSTGGIPLLDE
jgi:hypothetical protein